MVGYFVVNTGAVEKVVAAGGEEFGVMDPLSGEIFSAAKDVLIAPCHSRFLVATSNDSQFFKTAATPDNCIAAQSNHLTSIPGPWSVSPICGGPTLPAPRKLEPLVGWDTFDEFFSGTMLYQTTFDTPDHLTTAPPNHPTILSLGDVREIALVRINGRDLGVRFMPPYEFVIPPSVLKEKGNDLEVEVTNLGSNRLRWNDLNNVPWKCFSDINMVDINYKRLDASNWSVLKSGLLGPVIVR